VAGLGRAGRWQPQPRRIARARSARARPDAEFDAVRKAWRTRAKEVHPDVRPGDEAAAAEFQKLQLAYEVLRAAQERREWKG
jgi:hypothetical protein